MTDDIKRMSEFVKSVKGKPYSKDFWEKINQDMKDENERYEELCRNMQIDPISGKSTMSWEDRNKMFNF